MILKFPECILDEVQPCIDAGLGPVVELADIRSDSSPDYLIIPGGSPEAALASEELAELIRKLDGARKLVAGICNGSLIVANAGILYGRECTHTAIPKYAPVPEFAELLAAVKPILEGAIYVDQDVVISRNVITAKPWASQEFAKAVKRFIGKVDNL